jgi:hypothetical protein
MEPWFSPQIIFEFGFEFAKIFKKLCASALSEIALSRHQRCRRQHQDDVSAVGDSAKPNLQRQHEIGISAVSDSADADLSLSETALIHLRQHWVISINFKWLLSLSKRDNFWEKHIFWTCTVLTLLKNEKIVYLTWQFFGSALSLITLLKVLFRISLRNQNRIRK